MPTIHPVLASIQDDDAEVIKALAGIRVALLPVPEMIANGPKRRTGLYDDINRGLLVTCTIGGRRFAYALDYAKYIVALTRLDALEGKTHHLAKCENRPASDRKTRQNYQAA
jgi:hypothetical protein